MKTHKPNCFCIDCEDDRFVENEQKFFEALALLEVNHLLSLSESMKIRDRIVIRDKSIQRSKERKK